MADFVATITKDQRAIGSLYYPRSALSSQHS
jgi:hypothetical protein